MFRAGLGFILIGAFLTAMAAPQCGTPTAKLHEQAWRLGDPTALLIQAADTVDPIVGMWHVMFTAEGNSEGPPDGTPIDNALVVWHADGTEIMNSGRPPQDGDFCMGVWKKAGPNRYHLNHFALGRQRYRPCADRDWESSRADPDHRSGYFVGRWRLF